MDAIAHVAWADENGQSYYDALATALNSSESDSEEGGGDEGGTTVVTLTSISATYGGGEVASGTTLSDLTDIVVTGIYSDGSTKIITNYTLSGEIVEGTNTITVSYADLSLRNIRRNLYGDQIKTVTGLIFYALNIVTGG